MVLVEVLILVEVEEEVEEGWTGDEGTFLIFWISRLLISMVSFLSTSYLSCLSFTTFVRPFPLPSSSLPYPFRLPNPFVHSSPSLYPSIAKHTSLTHPLSQNSIEHTTSLTRFDPIPAYTLLTTIVPTLLLRSFRSFPSFPSFLPPPTNTSTSTKKENNTHPPNNPHTYTLPSRSHQRRSIERADSPSCVRPT